LELTGNKVLIIVENLPVPLDRRVWQESLALKEAGYDVTVVCPQMRGYDLSEEQLEGVKIYRHPIAKEASGILGFLIEYTSALWGETLCVYKVWKNGGFDIIHLCNPPDILFLVALPYKLFFGVRIIFDVHDLWPEMFEAKFSRRNPLIWAVLIAEKFTVKISDIIIATNKSVKSIIKNRHNKDDDSIFIVRTSPHNIDKEIESVPKRRNGKKYLVGYIGVMGDSDGLQYLLEAIKYIIYKYDRKDIQFSLMGTGPQFENLNKIIKDYSIEEYVEMPGRVLDQYLFETLVTMDLGVGCDPINKYNDHCTMNKTLEYMAFGKPQVMFAIKEGKVSAAGAAVYVDENCPKKLAQAIVTTLDNASLRDKMSEIALKRINGKLSWKESKKSLLNAYQKCASI